MCIALKGTLAAMARYQRGGGRSGFSRDWGGQTGGGRCYRAWSRSYRCDFGQSAHDARVL